ncbi:hypothetical protein COL26b_000306 [Colletotrichum chrysophilum]|uniref:uncharacterized protein n=1 Tax=Colletotrichum chrysophilum TaxID=1836956 RepID=UPI002300CC19|nr:uncharacterized protein COL26b_000306 [Colletotrichum chrysophilum]KAJ0381628.1 hypothetical protein COL26b_000306 [Colletotrichum chrysophilum]
MATIRPALRIFSPLGSIRCTPAARPHTPARQFFNLPNIPSSEPQVLTASRTLPYPSAQLYDVISDVDSYSTFVPYCAQSRVTQWTAPDKNGRKWPAQADLRVGWGGFEETFTNVPGASPGNGGEGGAVFRSLVTMWQLRPLATGTGTEVDLVIRFQFANPLYSAVSAAVSDKVAGVMIQAFEKRVKGVLGRPRI